MIDNITIYGTELTSQSHVVRPSYIKTVRKNMLSLILLVHLLTKAHINAFIKTLWLGYSSGPRYI